MPNYVEFGKGTASDEQDLVTKIRDFISGILGWSFLSAVTDSASDRDYVFYSRGEVPGRYQDLYIRWRGESNYLYTYGYSRWSSAVDYDGELYDASYTKSPCADSDFNYWLFGDLDGVWVVWESGGDYYSAYGGYIDTYYNDADDTIPVAVIGQPTNSTWYTGNRILMYNKMLDPWGSAASGTARRYLTHDDTYTYMLQYHDPSDRDGTDQGHMPFVIMRSDAGADGYEVRGELKHTVRFAGTTLSSEDWYTVSGTSYKYFITSYSANNTQGYGPVIASSGVSW